MNVVSNREELKHFLNLAAMVSKQYPVVVSEFIQQAKEIEIDAVAKNGELQVYALSEHVEVSQFDRSAVVEIGLLRIRLMPVVVA